MAPGSAGMIALAPLLLAPAALFAPLPAPDAAAREDEYILVTAERLRTLEVSVGQDGEGRWRCSLGTSSGTAWIDDRLCRATTRCVRRHGNDREEIGQCVAGQHGGILADVRRALRGNGR